MARAKRRVVLCGNSLFMAGLEASLKNRPAVFVERVEMPLAEFPRDLDDDLPNILIFDLALPHLLGFSLGSLVAALCEGTDLLLIGLDSNSSKAVVLTGSRRRILCADDLSQILLAYPVGG